MLCTNSASKKSEKGKKEGKTSKKAQVIAPFNFYP